MNFMPPGGAGPASIQQLAQNAAQNVLRRQRMKALLSGAAAGGSAGSAVGGSRPIRGSFSPHTMQLNPGQFRLPYQTLADLAAGAAAPRGSHAGSGSGGMIGGGGGGYDFSSLPDPTDHAQSPASVQGPMPTSPAPAPSVGTAMAGGPGTEGVIGGPGGGAPAVGGGPLLPSSVNSGSGFDGAIHGWIPLGGGLFYDQATGMVRGGQSADAPSSGLNPIDRRF